MKTHGFGVAMGCLVGALAAMSCDEGEAPATVLSLDDAVPAFEQAWCERLVECDCNPSTVQSPEDCRYEIDARIEAMRQVGEDGGLVYDGACLGATLDWLDDQGCGPAPDDDDRGCVAPCNVYHGDRVLGDSCEEFGNFDDCAQGLDCGYRGCEEEPCTPICYDPCERAAIGESCDNLLCVDGAVCVYENEEQTCRRLPKVDAECLQGQCADGLFCVIDPVDPTIQTCAAPAPVGGACMGHVQCESRYCPAGYCQEPPGRGEDCFGACADGLRCDFENKCVDAGPGICNEHPL